MLDELKVKELKTIINAIGCGTTQSKDTLNTLNTLNTFVGKKVIVRTCYAGVHFGRIIEKAGNEVILKDSRRLYYWKCKQSISLSSIAKYGIHSDSRVCAPVDIWIEAIELIPCTDEAIKSIEEAPIDQAR